MLSENKKKNFKKQISQNQKTTIRRRLNKSTLIVGNVYEFKVTSIAPSNIGIDELTYPIPVFIPNATFGTVQARVINTKTSANFSQYAIAQLINNVSSQTLQEVPPLEPGKHYTVQIKRKSTKGAGIAELEINNKTYTLIIPFLPNSHWTRNDRLPQTLDVVVTRSKANYSVAYEKQDYLFSWSQKKNKTAGQLNLFNSNNVLKHNDVTLALGSKFTTLLPTNIKRYQDYVIGRIQNTILFLKLEPHIILGQTNIRVKIVKQFDNRDQHYLLGRIIQSNPMEKQTKTRFIIQNIREMLLHGMHFGEKTVKCHARMKNYIWYQKEGQNPNKAFVQKSQHIINLLKTRKCLSKALTRLAKCALKGRTFLFIGTKKPAASLIARASFLTQNSFYVNTRWLGGMLTNWKTICKSIAKIRPILRQKHKRIREILQRRQKMKSRLIQKAFLLKNKTQLILIKARFILQQFKNNPDRIFQHAKQLSDKRFCFINQGMIYLQKRKQLIQKRRDLLLQTVMLNKKTTEISSQYSSFLAQLAAYNKKLRESQYLLRLVHDVQYLQQENTALYSVPYANINNLNVESSAFSSQIVPNPPKSILNQFVSIVASSSLLQTQNTSFKHNSFEHSTSVKGVQPKNQTTNIVICSSLLIRFASQLNPYIQSIIENLMDSINKIKLQCINTSTQLMKIQKTLQSYTDLKVKYKQEFQMLKTKAKAEKKAIQMVKRPLKALDAQKKCIRFLPRLRFLPTPQSQISEIVQTLLLKIVDPKLKYPIETIYETNLGYSSKKEAAERKKKWQRLEKYFGGIANMTKLSQTKRAQNIAIIIGQREEMNAVRECRKLGIQTLTIVDTNCDPTLSDHIIPANDDSRNAIKYILGHFIYRIRLAQKLRSRLLRRKQVTP